MRSRSTTLTTQELEIMKIVWERDSVTVRDVYEALLERRKVAYTTVMTMMSAPKAQPSFKKLRALSMGMVLAAMMAPTTMPRAALTCK